MLLKAVYPDGSWLVGRLYRHWWRYNVTPGTHHLLISCASGDLRHLVGAKVAVVVAQVKYFVLEHEEKS